jgi:hypothetical protein
MVAWVEFPTTKVFTKKVIPVIRIAGDTGRDIAAKDNDGWHPDCGGGMMQSPFWPDIQPGA